MSLFHTAHITAKMCGKSTKQDDIIVNSAPVGEEIYGDKSETTYAFFELITDSGSVNYILAAIICLLIILYIMRKKIRQMLGKIVAQSPPAPAVAAAPAPHVAAPPAPSVQLTPRMFRRLYSAPAILSENLAPGATGLRG